MNICRCSNIPAIVPPEPSPNPGPTPGPAPSPSPSPSPEPSPTPEPSPGPSPVPIPSPSPLPPEPPPPAPAILPTGDIEILLKWNNLNDLDISCIDPSGAEISWRNPHSATGGKLEIDMNAKGKPTSRTPIEYIYWATGSAPSGVYRVYLTHAGQHDEREDATQYTITVKYGEQSAEYSGVITINSRRQICTFSF